jgi:hypothetical protein
VHTLKNQAKEAWLQKVKQAVIKQAKIIKKNIEVKVNNNIMAIKNLNPVTSIMDFKTFAKNPIIATMFLVIIGISVLYIDIRGNFNSQLEAQSAKIEKLEAKMDAMGQSLIKCESAMSGASAKLSTLESLGKIQKIK